VTNEFVQEVIETEELYVLRVPPHLNSSMLQVCIYMNGNKYFYKCMWMYMCMYIQLHVYIHVSCMCCAFCRCQLVHAVGVCIFMDTCICI